MAARSTRRNCCNSRVSALLRNCAATIFRSSTTCRVWAKICRTISISAWHGNHRETDMLGIGVRGTFNLVKHILAWRRDGTGLIATPFAEGGAFLKSDPWIKRSRPASRISSMANVDRPRQEAASRAMAIPATSAYCRPHAPWPSVARQRRSRPLRRDRPALPFGRSGTCSLLMVRGFKLMRQVLIAQRALAEYRGSEMYLTSVRRNRRAELMANRALTRRHDVPPGGHLPNGRRDRMAVVDAQLQGCAAWKACVWSMRRSCRR